MKTFKSFEYSFSAGETKTLMGGRYFLLESVTNPVSVSLFTAKGTKIGTVENVTSGFNIDMLDSETDSFGYCRITSDTAQTVRAIISDAKVQVFKTSTEINGGEVAILRSKDSNFYDYDKVSNNENSFADGNYIGSVGASDFGIVYLKNNTGSGVKLFIDEIIVIQTYDAKTTPAPNYYHIGVYNGTPGGSVSFTGKSKTGKTNSTARFYSNTATTGFVAAGGVEYYLKSDKEWFEYKPKTPFVVDEGYYIYVAASKGVNFKCLFEWREYVA